MVVCWHEVSGYVMMVNEKPVTKHKPARDMIPNMLENGWRVAYVN